MRGDRMDTVFLAWQSPEQRSWLPIGRLMFEGDHYEFVYLKGAREAKEKLGFEALTNFPNLREIYRSTELFPLFSNRLPSRSRPDYGEFVQWLNIPEDEADPIAILARSGGRRATDSLEVFPYPEQDDAGRLRLHFFAHGLRYLSPESIARTENLKRGERLLLTYDFQNPHDSKALFMRTNDSFSGDRYLVGYCPRYLLDDIFKVLEEESVMSEVTVERVNPAPAPQQVRLLCRLTAPWPKGFRPFEGQKYQPIVKDAKRDLLRRMRSMRQGSGSKLARPRKD